jgi:MFS family permease
MIAAYRSRRAAWMVVGLLWLVALLNYLDRQLVTTMGKPIKAELDIGDAQFGLFTSVFLLVYGVCSPFAGFLADRFGRRPVIIGSLAIWSLATLWTGFVRSFEEMLAARAVMGLSEAFYMPAAVALIVDYHRGRTRSRATGLHLSGTYAGAVFGGLGGWMAEEQGWRFGFQLFGIVGVAYALVLVVFLKNPPPGSLEKEDTLEEIESHQPKLARALAELFTTRGFVMLLVMNALVGAAYWPLRNWLPEFFRTELDVDPRWSGLYGTSTFHAAAFAGNLIAGSWSDFWSRTNPRARTLIPAIGYAIATVCFLTMGVVTLIPILIGAVVFAGMAHGFLDANLMPATCLQIEKRYWATGYGLLNLAGTTAGGIMTFVGGWLKDSQVPLSSTFAVVAWLVLSGSLLLFAVRPPASVSR